MSLFAFAIEESTAEAMYFPVVHLTGRPAGRIVRPF